MRSTTDSDNSRLKGTQNYFKIKGNCRDSKKLFEDELFKADKNCLPRKYAYDTIEWRRPHVYEHFCFVSYLFS